MAALAAILLLLALQAAASEGAGGGQAASVIVSSPIGAESDLQVVGIDDRKLNGGIGISGGREESKLVGPNVCTQQEP